MRYEDLKKHLRTVFLENTEQMSLTEYTDSIPELSAEDTEAFIMAYSELSGLEKVTLQDIKSVATSVAERTKKEKVKTPRKAIIVDDEDEVPSKKFA